jgi:hypothetical protein
MKQTFLLLMAALVGALMLVACGGNDVTDLERAQGTTSNNALYNLRNDYLPANPRYASYTVDVQGDAAVSDVCLQGSGWANIVLHQGADSVAVSCPTWRKGVCVTLTQPSAPACNPSLHYPFDWLNQGQ